MFQVGLVRPVRCVWNVLIFGEGHCLSHMLAHSSVQYYLWTPTMILFSVFD